jgi:hypothetical protein
MAHFIVYGRRYYLNYSTSVETLYITCAPLGDNLSTNKVDVYMQFMMNDLVVPNINFKQIRPVQ